MLGVLWATIPMNILSIVGTVLLAVLALSLAGLLLFLFFPFTYRVSGSKNGEGIRLAVKVNWLFGLFRVRFRYPEPGRLTVKVLCFSLFDSKIPPDPKEGGGRRKRGRKSPGRKRSGFWKKKSRESQAEKKRPNGKKDAPGAEDSPGGSATLGQGKGNPTGAPNATDIPDRTAAERAGACGGAGADNRGAFDRPSPADDSAPGSSGSDNGRALDKTGPADGSAQGSSGSEKGRAFDRPAPADDSAQGSQDADNRGAFDRQDSADDSAQGSSDSENGGAFDSNGESPGSPGKFSRKFQKIKFTICSIYDKIKKIWKNISYYIELLQEENTRQLAAHAMQRARKVMKSVWPKHIRAELVFGTGSPDTTGYLYGGYCMAASVLGTGFWVTPDFQRQIFEGEFEAAGSVTVWVLAVNGLKLLFDRKLRVFLRGLRDAHRKASA